MRYSRVFDHVNTKKMRSKKESSPLRNAEESDYFLAPQGQFPYSTLREGAKKIGITTPRMSRLLRILEVPVHRCGYTILLDEAAVRRIARAVRDSEVKPGRKKRTDPIEV